MKSVKKILTIDSNYEEITKAGYLYREKNVYPHFTQNGFEIIKAVGSRASRWFVKQEAIKEEVKYLTGVGHGLPDLYTGHHGDKIFQIGDYDPKEVKEKVIHFLSCHTAKQLGPDFVKNGCRAYFGYTIEFGFTMPDSDIFFECDSTIDIEFAKGKTAGEVADLTTQKFQTHIDELENEGRFWVASILEDDLEHLMSPTIDKIYGSKSAKI